MIIYAVFNKLEINTLAFKGLEIQFVESFYKKENAELKAKECKSPEIVEITLPSKDEYQISYGYPDSNSYCECHFDKLDQEHCYDEQDQLIAVQTFSQPILKI